MEKFWQRRSHLGAIFLAGIFLLAVVLILSFNIRPSDNLFVVHYKALSGVDSFGSWFDVYYLIFVGLLLGGINLFLANLFYQRWQILAQWLIFSLPVLEFFLFLASLSLVYVNR